MKDLCLPNAYWEKVDRHATPSHMSGQRVAGPDASLIFGCVRETFGMVRPWEVCSLSIGCLRIPEHAPCQVRKPRFARFDPTLILAISDIVGHPTESAFRRRAGYDARLLRRDDDPLAGAAHTDLPPYQHRDIEGQRDRDWMGLTQTCSSATAIRTSSAPQRPEREGRRVRQHVILDNDAAHKEVRSLVVPASPFAGSREGLVCERRPTASRHGRPHR